MPDPTRNIPFGRPLVDDTDRAEVMAVLDSPILTHGPRCGAFEAAFTGFLGGGHAVTTSSCTAALHLFNMYLEVGAGDEVILPAISHVATAHALEITGATPVFVDCNDVDGNIEAAGLETAIGPKTKAICLVHFNGLPADMTEIMDIADKNGLPVLEDCATALGGFWDDKHVGLYGDAAAFSFYPAKHITAAEGGMFVSRDEDITEQIRRLRGFCYDRSLYERKLPGIYDVDGLGINYRMSELQAALGLSQLKRARSFLDIREKNFAAYKERLGNVKGLRILEPADQRAVNAYYCLTVMLSEAKVGVRDELLARLPTVGVGVSVHYPHPLPRLSYYRKKYGYNDSTYPNAELISDTSINLPLGPHIDANDVDYICTQFVTMFKELNS